MAITALTCALSVLLAMRSNNTKAPFFPCPKANLMACSTISVTHSLTFSGSLEKGSSNFDMIKSTALSIPLPLTSSTA